MPLKCEVVSFNTGHFVDMASPDSKPSLSILIDRQIDRQISKNSERKYIRNWTTVYPWNFGLALIPIPEKQFDLTGFDSRHSGKMNLVGLRVFAAGMVVLWIVT